MSTLYATKVPSAVHQQVPSFCGTWKGTRNLIKSLLEQEPSVNIPVDSNHCLQVHKDPDLRKLVKDEFLVKGGGS